MHFTDVTTLLAPNGAPYPTAGLDPEGLVLTKDRRLILTSEGIPATLIDPFVRRYRLDGSFVGDLPVPQAFRVTADQSSGVRPNLGFEAAATDGRHFYTATENALFQDGPAATIANGSPSRLLRYDLQHEPARAPVGLRDRPGGRAAVPTVFSVNGIVELLPIDHDTLISMERSFSVGAPGTGNKIKLYTVSLRGGVAHKRLLLDLDDLGIPLDNVEGITFGPRLRDGRRSLVLVSDNNFAADPVHAVPIVRDQALIGRRWPAGRRST